MQEGPTWVPSEAYLKQRQSDQEKPRLPHPDLATADKMLRLYAGSAAPSIIESFPAFSDRVQAVEDMLRFHGSNDPAEHHAQLHATIRREREDVWKEIRQAATLKGTLREGVLAQSVTQSLNESPDFGNFLKPGGVLAEWGSQIYTTLGNSPVFVHYDQAATQDGSSTLDTINLSLFRPDELQVEMTQFYDAESNRLAYMEASKGFVVGTAVAKPGPSEAMAAD